MLERRCLSASYTTTEIEINCSELNKTEKNQKVKARTTEE